MRKGGGGVVLIGIEKNYQTKNNISSNKTELKKINKQRQKTRMCLSE